MQDQAKENELERIQGDLETSHVACYICLTCVSDSCLPVYTELKQTEFQANALALTLLASVRVSLEQTSLTACHMLSGKCSDTSAVVS